MNIFKKIKVYFQLLEIERVMEKYGANEPQSRTYSKLFYNLFFNMYAQTSKDEAAALIMTYIALYKDARPLDSSDPLSRLLGSKYSGNYDDAIGLMKKGIASYSHIGSDRKLAHLCKEITY